MSWPSHVFIGGSDTTEPITSAVASTFGSSFAFPEDDDPHLQYGTADIYAGFHDFEDDDLRWPDSTSVPLHSAYPLFVEVRDTSKNIPYQQELARRVFEALRELGRWRLLYVDNLQTIVSAYDPQQPAAREAP